MHFGRGGCKKPCGTAADLSRRDFVKEEDEKKGRSSGEGRRNAQNKANEERRKKAMKERGAQGILDPRWRNPNKDSNLVVNWMTGKCKINNQRYRKMIQKTKNMLDKTDLRPKADHLDIFHHVYREWNQDADRLTHVAREKGPHGIHIPRKKEKRLRQCGFSVTEE